MSYQCGGDSPGCPGCSDCQPATGEIGGSACNHGIEFDEVEAAKILGDWEARTVEEFVVGNPAAQEVRKRWPRLDGRCPKGCGYVGIYYASSAHYTMGDW